MRHAVHVLSLPMASLQVGHLRLLTEHGSPFVSGDGADLGDLILAALICSMPQEQARKSINAWWLRLFMRCWGWRCARLANRGRLVWIMEAGKLRKHITDALATQGIKASNGGRSMASPLHLRLYLVLKEELGLTHAEALDFPVRDAVDLWTTLAEKRGALEFWSEREREHMRIHREMEAAWLAEQGRNN